MSTSHTEEHEEATRCANATERSMDVTPRLRPASLASTATISPPTLLPIWRAKHTIRRLGKFPSPWTTPTENRTNWCPTKPTIGRLGSSPSQWTPNFGRWSYKRTTRSTIGRLASATFGSQRTYPVRYSGVSVSTHYGCLGVINREKQSDSRPWDATASRRIKPRYMDAITK